jgi:anti-sigma B factor antagonist
VVVACCYVGCARTAEADHGRLKNSGLIGHSTESVVPAPYSIEVTAHRGWVVIQLCGEVDIQAVPPLQAALASALLDAPDSLHIDLAEVTYLSLSAMGAILAARDRAVRAHTDVVIPDPPRALRKLMDFVDPDDLSTEPTATVA